MIRHLRQSQWHANRILLQIHQSAVSTHLPYSNTLSNPNRNHLTQKQHSNSSPLSSVIISRPISTGTIAGYTTAIGIGVFLTGNIAFLGSALPALVGKGAPYLPTFSKTLRVIFDEALPQVLQRDDPSVSPTIIDLGSGDGRVVIEACRRGYASIGYEINPVLVICSKIWSLKERLFNFSEKKGTASFYTANLWNVNLSEADIIFVYGLDPIMKELSDKILKEGKKDVIVISNVFEMDSRLWRTVFVKEKVRLYRRLDYIKEENATATL